MNVSEFHFLRPLWLLLLPVCAAMTVLIWRFLGKKSDWSHVVSAKLLAVLSTNNRSTKSWGAYMLLCVVWLLAIVAMAGPTWERRPQPLYEQNQSRVILFDLSLSMNSTDLKPSRLQLAKFKLMDLIQSAENKQQALVVFAGDAFIVAPLTNDAETLINLVPGLDVNTVPVQGSRVDKALKLAATLIRNAGVASVEIVLITDGADTNSINVARELANAGHRLQVLGVGTDQGAPVVLEDGSLLKDQSGNIVIPVLDQSWLQALATAGAGRYANMGLDNTEIARLNATEAGLEVLLSDARSTTLFGDSWVDTGTLLLIPLLLLASLGFRKGWLLVLVLVVAPVTEEAYAFEWQDLWLTPNQRAARSMQVDETKSAPAGASNEWHAAAAFKQNRFQDAAETYEALSLSDQAGPSDFYNLGNAFAKSGDLQQALTSYDKALELDPKLQDAIYNQNIVRQLLEKQEEKEDDTESEQSDQENSGQEKGDEQSQQDNQSSGQRSSKSEEMQGEQNQQQEQQEAQAAEDQPADAQDQMEQAEGGQEENISNEESQQVSELEQTENLSRALLSEEQQALEQWLKKIPDDPGGLLKRKFLYQYRLRQQAPREALQW